MAALFGASVQRNLDSFGHANTAIANLKHTGPLTRKTLSVNCLLSGIAPLSVLQRLVMTCLIFRDQRHPRSARPRSKIDNNASRSNILPLAKREHLRQGSGPHIASFQAAGLATTWAQYSWSNKATPMISANAPCTTLIKIGSSMR